MSYSMRISVHISSAALAAVLFGRVPVEAGTLVVLSGGNVDVAAYARALIPPPVGDDFR